MKLSRVALSALSLLLVVPQVNANGIILVYSEGTDIDWNFFNFGLNGPDTYMIEGTVGITSDDADLDTFNFNVPVGLEVTNIKYQIYSLDGSQPYNYTYPDMTDRFGVGMDASDPGAWGTWEIDIAQVLNENAGIQLLLGTGDGPLAAGDYEFNPYLWTMGNGYGSWNYGITFELEPATVAPVPVPAAAWLFSFGLLGLIGLARRKGA